MEEEGDDGGHGGAYDEDGGHEAAPVEDEDVEARDEEAWRRLAANLSA